MGYPGLRHFQKFPKISFCPIIQLNDASFFLGKIDLRTHIYVPKSMLLEFDVISHKFSFAKMTSPSITPAKVPTTFFTKLCQDVCHVCLQLPD